MSAWIGNLLCYIGAHLTRDRLILERYKGKWYTGNGVEFSATAPAEARRSRIENDVENWPCAICGVVPALPHRKAVYPKVKRTLCEFCFEIHFNKANAQHHAERPKGAIP